MVTKADYDKLARKKKFRHPNGAPNYTTIARELGMNVNTLKHRVQHNTWSGKPGRVADPAKAKAPPPPPPTLEEHRTITGLRDEVSRLRKQLTDAHRSSIDDEAIREILGGLVAEPVQPPQWLFDIKRKKGTAAQVPVTIWSDWHGGEVVSRSETNGVNEFDFAILERRVQRLVTTTIDLTRNHGPGNYPGIVVNMLGDFVSGGLHAELLKTDEEETLPTVLRMRDLLVTALETMIEEYGQVYCP